MRIQLWLTHLILKIGRALHDGAYLFPTDRNLCLSTRKPDPYLGYLETFIANQSLDCLSGHFIRFGLTRAKALQTVIRFSRETRRRCAGPKSETIALSIQPVLF